MYWVEEISPVLRRPKGKYYHIVRTDDGDTVDFDSCRYKKTEYMNVVGVAVIDRKNKRAKITYYLTR